MQSISEKINYGVRIEILFFSCVIFFVTFKPAFKLDDWAVPNLPQYVYFIQNLSQYISSLGLILCVSIFFLVSKNIKIRLSLTSITIAFVLILYALRSFMVGSQDYKNIISMILIFLIFIYFSSFNNSYRKCIPYYSILIAMGLWLLFNISLLSFGYGYALLDTSSRFFGISPHPNFTGAYACVSLAFFLIIFLKNRIYLNKFLFFALIGSSITLIVLSGSRSALLGALVCLMIGLPNKYKLYPIILGFIFYLIFFVFYIDNQFYLALDRMKNAPLNNRNVVWSFLMDDFFRNPIWGSGDFSGVSGSGFLTALGGTGLMGGAFFIISMLVLLLISFRNILFVNYFNRNNEEYCLIFIMIFLLSFFEGYVFDKFGLFQILLLLSATMIGPFSSKNFIFK